MAARVFLVKLVTRPILVPIGVGAFGLWYGGFDVAYIVSRKVATKLNPDLPIDTSRKNRVISSLAGVSTGALFAYLNAATNPFNNVDFPELHWKSALKDIPVYMKSNFEVMKKLNVKRGIVLFVSSGFISGVCKSLVESYLSNHL